MSAACVLRRSKADQEHSLAGAQLYGQVTGDADGLETVDGV